MLKFQQVKLVGCITNIEEGTAHLNITLHDGYNQTTVKRWSDGEENEFEARKRAQLQYVVNAEKAVLLSKE